MMRNIQLIVMLQLAILMVSCSEHEIQGKVIDNFGKPVEDMKVAIINTSLETSTNRVAISK